MKGLVLRRVIKINLRMVRIRFLHNGLFKMQKRVGSK